MSMELVRSRLFDRRGFEGRRSELAIFCRSSKFGLLPSSCSRRPQSLTSTLTSARHILSLVPFKTQPRPVIKNSDFGTQPALIESPSIRRSSVRLLLVLYFLALNHFKTQSREAHDIPVSIIFSLVALKELKAASSRSGSPFQKTSSSPIPPSPRARILLPSKSSAVVSPSSISQPYRSPSDSLTSIYPSQISTTMSDLVRSSSSSRSASLLLRPAPTRLASLS